MLNKIKSFGTRLHEDESGPNTVEWVLLIIIALVLLVAIFKFAAWAFDEFDSKATDVKESEILQPQGNP